jgi:hypothetical protein
MFTARYALSPYIKQIRFFFKGLKYNILWKWRLRDSLFLRSRLKEGGGGEHQLSWSH